MFRRFFAPIAGLLLFLVFTGCLSEQERFFRQVLAMPAKRLESFAFDPASAIESRIGAAPEPVLEYMREADGRDDYAAYEPTPAEREATADILAGFPARYRGVFAERCIGIFFVEENFLGSGMADYVFSENRTLYFYILVNRGVLTRGLSEQYRYRESTCFVGGDDAGFGLRFDCGTGRTGLLYILLHEGSHAFDYIVHVTPFTEPNMNRLGLGVPAPTAFTEGVWTDYGTPVEEYDYPLRGFLSFYGMNDGPSLSTDQAEALYDQLLSTPFVSLYGSRSWAEDYAELMTAYHLTRVLGLPYEISFVGADGSTAMVRPAENPMVVARFSMLEEFYRE